jgi:NADH-quinone oxidoreductase subunit M
VGVILAAVYLLWAYQRAFTGVPSGANATLSDLKVRELTAVVPLLALSLFLGIYPKPVIDRVEPSVRRVICGVERGSDYKEPAVATRKGVFAVTRGTKQYGIERADCAKMNDRELAGR